MESTKDAIEEMRRLKAELPPRPSPESVNFATQMIERVDSTLSTRLDQLSQQPTPSRIPYFVFRAYLQMCEDLMRKEVIVGTFAGRWIRILLNSLLIRCISVDTSFGMYV